MNESIELKKWFLLLVVEDEGIVINETFSVVNLFLRKFFLIINKCQGWRNVFFCAYSVWFEETIFNTTVKSEGLINLKQRRKDSTDVFRCIEIKYPINFLSVFYSNVFLIGSIFDKKSNRNIVLMDDLHPHLDFVGF